MPVTSCGAGIHCNANAEQFFLQNFSTRQHVSNTREAPLPPLSFSCSSAINYLELNHKMHNHTASEQNRRLSKSGFQSDLIYYVCLYLMVVR